MPRQSEAVLAAIKQAVDLVALVGEYLPVQRSGSRFKALCPFHDDHNPSLELNPERQSFKCWSCGAGGDVFDFIQRYERVEFSEALRMLADRAGIALESGTERSVTAPAGPSRADLLAVTAWARDQFVAALPGSAEGIGYVRRRGVADASVRRFHLGYAPDQRDWLQARARRDGLSLEVLEQVGLIARSPETGLTRDRFRGRLIFPIHDVRGRVIGFGGRILPEAEAKLTAQGQRVAKYLNSPETPLFQKRRTLYAADLARDAARKAGWAAVVEGYTDVIAAHQAGIENVVGTLGTALGDDHVALLRRLADRVVLVFDGDEAGQKAADRSLELFLGHAVDVRVLTLPEGLDPCDFLMAEGGGAAFRALVDRAVDPLAFAIERAAGRFDLDSPEGARLASEWVLGLLGRVRTNSSAGIDLKVAKALDTLSRRLRIPVEDLRRSLRRTRSRTSPGASSVSVEPRQACLPASGGYRLSDLDALERELLRVALSHPEAILWLRPRIASAKLENTPLQAILQAGYDLCNEDVLPIFDRIILRLQEPPLKQLALDLVAPIEESPLSVPSRQHEPIEVDPEDLKKLIKGPKSGMSDEEYRALFFRIFARPSSVSQSGSPELLPPWQETLSGLFLRWAEREWNDRLRDLKAAIHETDPTSDPDAHEALRREYLRVLNQRPDLRKQPAS